MAIIARPAAAEISSTFGVSRLRECYCRAGVRALIEVWQRRFDEPIELPDDRKLRTLADAIAWLAKEIPKSEHEMKQVQAAAHCVSDAAENDGPIIFAHTA